MFLTRFKTVKYQDEYGKAYNKPFEPLGEIGTFAFWVVGEEIIEKLGLDILIFPTENGHSDASNNMN